MQKPNAYFSVFANKMVLGELCRRKIDEVAFKELQWGSAVALMKYCVYTKQVLLLRRSDEAISAVHFPTGCLM